MTDATPETSNEREPSADDRRFRELLDAASTLKLARDNVDELAMNLPMPAGDMNGSQLFMSLLAHRGKSLYANFHNALSSPTEIGPVLALRPLVELTIIIKWVSLDPDFHGALYVADSDASELSHLEAIRPHAEMRGQAIPESLNSAVAEKKATRDAWLAELKARGLNFGKNRITPDLRRKADAVIKQIPGHRGVMNDAYIYADKTFSPWEHSEASSFKATAEDSPDGWRWLGDKSPWHPEDLEAIATNMYAYVLETAFANLSDAERAVLARRLRDFVMAKYVRSDRRQPTTGEPQPLDDE